MKLLLDYNYTLHSKGDFLGYVGETNSRKITVEGYQTDGADLYKLRLSMPDKSEYEVDISSGEYTIPGSLLSTAGYVRLQVVAVKVKPDGVYEYVKKSNVVSGIRVEDSLDDKTEPIPTYEDAVQALDKVLAAVETSSDNAVKSEQYAESANAAMTAAENARTAAQQAEDSAATSYEGANKAAQDAAESAQTASVSADNTKQSEQSVLSAKSSIESTAATILETAQEVSQNAQTVLKSTAIAENARDIAVEKAEEISDSTEQIRRNKEDIAALYNNKADGIICEAEGTDITVTDSSELGFKGMRIFGRSTQDGTPTPEEPVSIISAGNGGSITADILGGNMLDLSKTESEVKTWETGEQIVLINNYDGSLTVKGNAPSAHYFVSNQSCNVVELPKGNYVFSCDGSIDAGVQIIIRLFKKDGTQETVIIDTSYRRTFSVDEDTTKIIFFVQVKPGLSVDTTFKVMLNKGDTALPWESYKHQSLTVSTPNGLPGIPVTSGGNYTDENGQQWVCNEIDFKRGVYIRRIGSVVLDGVAHAEKSHTLIGNTTRYIFTIDEPCTINNRMSMCSALEWKYSYSSDTEHHYAQGNTLYIFIENQRLSEYESIDEYLKEHPMEVIYQLAEAAEMPLRDKEISEYKSLHTYKPTTVIANSDRAHMEVSYTADTKTYIDDRFAEIRAAIISTGGNV